MEDENDILHELGLTDGEIRVYLSLLNKGTQTATQLSKDTKLNRSNSYRILERLTEKKLAFSSIIEKTRYFSITRVERINEIYNQKISSLKDKEREIERFVKDAEKFSGTKIPKSEFAVEVHGGIEEIKRIMQNVLNLKRGEIVYAIGKEGVLAEYPGIKYWIDNFFKRRMERGIKFQAVYNLHENARRPRSKNTFVKYANLSGMGDIELSLYRNVLLIYVMTKEEPKVILIKNEDISSAMISYFKFLWNQAKEM